MTGAGLRVAGPGHSKAPWTSFTCSFRLSVALVFLIGAAFWWSVRSGQFDDLEGPAHRVVGDDDSPP